MAKIFVFISLILLITVSSCSKKDKPESINGDEKIKQKLELVIQEAIRLTNDPSEKELLKNAQPFVNLEGLDMDIVGFSIPKDKEGNLIHISFTLDYFQGTSFQSLAKKILESLHSQRNQGNDQGKDKKSG